MASRRSSGYPAGRASLFARQAGASLVLEAAPVFPEGIEQFEAEHNVTVFRLRWLRQQRLAALETSR